LIVSIAKLLIIVRSMKGDFENQASFSAA